MERSIESMIFEVIGLHLDGRFRAAMDDLGLQGGSQSIRTKAPKHDGDIVTIGKGMPIDRTDG
jgi:hypothetical protein